MEIVKPVWFMEETNARRRKTEHLQASRMLWNSNNGVVFVNSNSERWVKHYSSYHQILLVGEGDFSFSLSLAMGFGSAFNIVATSLDTYETLLMKYDKAHSNLDTLRRLGATILHGVDATKMKNHIELSKRKFDRIIFNFPHAGFYGKEDNPIMIEMHKSLLHGFFSNAKWLLERNGEIHVSHKNKVPYSDWDIPGLACQNSLHLIERAAFNIEDYPRYQNKRGHGSASDQPFMLGECCTFKFIVSPPLMDQFNDYFSNHMISKDGMSFQLDKFNRDPFNPNEISRQLLMTENSHNFYISPKERTPVFKFVVKGSIRPYSRVTIYEGVLKNPGNSVVAEFAGLLDDSDINVAELTAIRHALLMFERSDLCRKADLIVETDSSNAVSWIKSDFGNPWEVQPVINEIKLAFGRIRNADVHCNYGGHGAKIYNHLVDKLLEHRFERNRILEHWYWIGLF